MNFIDQLSANISLFSSAVGMNTAILDEKGTVVNRFGDEYRFCSLYHAYNGEHCTCKSEHCRGGLFSSTLGDCYFYLCPAKLVHFSDISLLFACQVFPFALAGIFVSDFH